MMREVTGHASGRVLIIVLLASLIFSVAIMPFIFAPNTIFFGWLTVPMLSGAVLMLVWLVAIVVYMSFSWPYR